MLCTFKRLLPTLKFWDNPASAVIGVQGVVSPKHKSRVSRMPIDLHLDLQYDIIIYCGVPGPSHVYDLYLILPIFNCRIDVSTLRAKGLLGSFVRVLGRWFSLETLFPWHATIYSYDN